MTICLKDILDYDLLQKHLVNGVVRRQVHPQYPNLFVYNYTEQAQFERIWDNVTNVCRGLIVADDCVIARGFNKFHNLNTEFAPETMEANLPKIAPLVTEKLDGSMGIQYVWDDKIWVATRGSFASEQAIWATDWLRKHYAEDSNYYWAHRAESPDWTMLFEIIYAENRIVVDYDFEGLIVIGLVRISTGEEADRHLLEAVAYQNGLDVVRRFNKSLVECAAENNLNEEGYVLTYSLGENVPPLKVKMKFVEYCRLHRILTGLNPRAIWEMLSANQNEAIDLILNDEKMPAAFKQWFNGWVLQLRQDFVTITTRATKIFLSRPQTGIRKDVALYFLQTAPDISSVLFAMLDGKDVSPIVWDKIRPKATDTFKQEEV